MRAPSSSLPRPEAVDGRKLGACSRVGEFGRVMDGRGANGHPPSSVHRKSSSVHLLNNLPENTIRQQLGLQPVMKQQQEEMPSNKVRLPLPTNRIKMLALVIVQHQVRILKLHMPARLRRQQLSV